MRWGNAGVTSLNHIMDTVTKNFLTFEKIKTLIKSNNFIRYYTLISNIPTDNSILQVALLNTSYKRHLSKIRVTEYFRNFKDLFLL
jgi:hypothetical protein